MLKVLIFIFRQGRGLMNLVSFSIRTKGIHNFARRLGTVFTRFSFTESSIRCNLYCLIDSLKRYNAAPTFFIPAVVLSRHPALITEIADCGAEIGVQGYVHNDYRTLSESEQSKRTEKAAALFEHLQLSYQGLRKSYLGWTYESLRVYAALNIKYESNEAVLHDVVDLNKFSPILRSGFDKSLALFQATPCSTYALRPHFESELLRIPTSIPDDEMLFDRLRITNPLEVGHIWSEVMQRVYDRGGLYTLNLHPERGILCKEALDTLLPYQRSRPLPVWVARIGDVAQWWKERSAFRLCITALTSGRWRVEASCSPRATLLARHLFVEEQPTTPWFGTDVCMQSHSFIVRASQCPCIGISPGTSQQVIDFLYEQGYPFMYCIQEESHNYACYLDL